VYCETLKKLRRAIQNRCGMLISSVLIVLLHDNARPHTAARTRAVLENSTGSCLTTLLTALISLQVTTNCLPTWRTGCDHNSSTIMRSWWKVSKRDWTHSWQTSLTQAYKNLFPDTSASIPAVTTLRSKLSSYVFFVYNTFFFSLLALLAAHRR
jgi:hypothetical protein